VRKAPALIPGMDRTATLFVPDGLFESCLSLNRDKSPG
jgi:hypothetical protein